MISVLDIGINTATRSSGNLKIAQSLLPVSHHIARDEPDARRVNTRPAAGAFPAWHHNTDECLLPAGDPADHKLTNSQSMLIELHPDCTALAGYETRSQAPFVKRRPPSLNTVTNVDALLATRRVTILPRTKTVGHCMLLHDPWACVAALARRLAA